MACLLVPHRESRESTHEMPPRAQNGARPGVDSALSLSLSCSARPSLLKRRRELMLQPNGHETALIAKLRPRRPSGRSHLAPMPSGPSESSRTFRNFTMVPDARLTTKRKSPGSRGRGFNWWCDACLWVFLRRTRIGVSSSLPSWGLDCCLLLRDQTAE